jgi:hypothetical protein
VRNNVYRGRFNIGINMTEVEMWSATIEYDGFGRQLWLIYRDKEVRGRLVIDVCNVSISVMTIDIDGQTLDISRIEDRLVVQKHRSDDAGDRYR